MIHIFRPRLLIIHCCCCCCFCLQSPKGLSPARADSKRPRSSTAEACCVGGHQMAAAHIDCSFFWCSFSNKSHITMSTERTSHRITKGMPLGHQITMSCCCLVDGIIAFNERCCIQSGQRRDWLRFNSVYFYKLLICKKYQQRRMDKTLFFFSFSENRRSSKPSNYSDWFYFFSFNLE